LKKTWLPNSPDLNPVHYSTVFSGGGGALQQLVYGQKFEDVDHLDNCWDMISQELIDAAIEQWFTPFSSVVRSRRGHIEHRFSYFWQLILA